MKQIKEQEAELRNKVYQCQNEPGLRAFVQLLEARSAQAVVSLRQARGLEELVRWQSAYNEAREMIDLVVIPPIKFGNKQ